MVEMVRAIASDSEIEALGVPIEEAGKAICKNVFPILKNHLAFVVQYDRNCFEAALVDEITQGEGPIASMELLEKVKEASEKIKELVGPTCCDKLSKAKHPLILNYCAWAPCTAIECI